MKTREYLEYIYKIEITCAEKSVGVACLLSLIICFKYHQSECKPKIVKKTQTFLGKKTKAKTFFQTLEQSFLAISNNTSIFNNPVSQQIPKIRINNIQVPIVHLSSGLDPPV